MDQRGFQMSHFISTRGWEKSCNYSQAMVDMPKLTCAVISAIQELHSCGIAHLGIRLDNICFEDEDDHFNIDKIFKTA